MRRVAIVDHGLGNILSVARAFEHLGVSVKLAESEKELDKVSHIVIPGVGAFPEAMRRLHSKGLVDALRRSADREIPLLGICLGMQVLFTTGLEHGTTEGLGIVSGSVTKMTNIQSNFDVLRLPSVGWREIVAVDDHSKESALIEKMSGKPFYFVHSYEAKPVHSEMVAAVYNRGANSIVAAVIKGNTWGVQFHPEKSGKFGLDLLKYFIDRR